MQIYFIFVLMYVYMCDAMQMYDIYPIQKEIRVDIGREKRAMCVYMCVYMCVWMTVMMLPNTILYELYIKCIQSLRASAILELWIKLCSKYFVFTGKYCLLLI